MAEKRPLGYLDSLEIDPRLAASGIGKYLTNIRLVILLILTIVSVGVFGYLQLPQRLNPEIKIPIVVVSTVLPGAGPEDIEKLLTIPIENELKGLSGIDTISSSSRNNVSIVSMQFLSSIDRDKAKNDVQSVVDGLSGLPEDATVPNVEALDFENQPVWQFALTTTGDTASLSEYAKQLKEIIKTESQVDRVVLSGLEEQQIVVEATPEKLSETGVNPLQLIGAIKTAIKAFPAGNVQTESNTFSLTIDPAISSVEDIRAIRVQLDGRSVRLGDVARVWIRPTPDQPLAFLATHDESARQVVSFSVYKSTSADIVKTATAVKTLVDADVLKTDGRFSVTSITNTGEQIQEQFTDLLGEFRSTIILVFICLFLFLGFRQAVISSFTVPLTFLAAFFFMRIAGMSINFLSLFAFLLALGLLVDDTIVVVSAMTSYFKSRRFSPTETGLLVWKDTIVPIWSTTITTIWSFVPLLLASGIIGEFIKPIPVVVSITMLSSTAISVFVTLPLMIVLLKPVVARRVVVLVRILGLLVALGVTMYLFKDNPLMPVIGILLFVVLLLGFRVRHVFWSKISRVGETRVVRAFSKMSQKGIIDVEPFAAWYKRQIYRILGSKNARRNTVIAIIAYAAFSFALLPMGLVKNEFFPKSDTDVLFVGLEMPAGMTLERTQAEALKVLDTLRQTDGIEFVQLNLGSGVSAGQGSTLEGTNLANFTLHLPEKAKRTATSIEVAENLRKQLKSYPVGKFSVVEESGGPPAGSDVQIELSGDSLNELSRISGETADWLRRQPGMTNVETSIKPGTSAVVFLPDLDKVSEAGVSVDVVGLWLRIYASGLPLSDINLNPRDPTDKQAIVFSYGNSFSSVEDIGRIQIPTSRGWVPVLSLGTLQTKTNPTIISRENGKRTVIVSGTVSQGYLATDKNAALLAYTKDLSLPQGYTWKTGGVNEENTKSVQSIVMAMGVAFLLILVTMVIQFQSFRQAVIVLLVIPLAVSSVFVVFALTGTPLSFPALIGILSLFGIVVTNSMFIVDKINLNKKQGMEFREAVADAGASRMEPIILTKLCTVLGLLPITLADPLWRGLGGAIISGLLVASTIMLLFIPVVYYDWMKDVSRKDGE